MNNNNNNNNNNINANLDRDDDDFTIEEIERYLDERYEADYEDLVERLYLEKAREEVAWSKQRCLNDYSSGDLRDNWEVRTDEQESELLAWANSETVVEVEEHDEMLEALREYENEEYEIVVREFFEDRRNEERIARDKNNN